MDRPVRGVGEEPARLHALGRSRGAGEEKVSGVDYQFSVEEKAGYLHVRVRGDNTPETVRRWVRDGLEALRKHRRGRVLVEECLEGESLNDRDTFAVVAEAAREARAQVTHMAYVDVNPAHRKEEISFAEYVARLRGVNMRVFSDVREAEAWLAQDPSGPAAPGRRDRQGR
jgi:hypothetical protein